MCSDWTYNEVSWRGHGPGYSGRGGGYVFSISSNRGPASLSYHRGDGNWVSVGTYPGANTRRTRRPRHGCRTNGMTGQPRLTVVPITFRIAEAYVRKYHRHNPPSRGVKFAIGVCDDEGRLRGVAMVGRPIARSYDDGLTIEVNRTATDGCPNANSALYGAAWRIAGAMGYRRMITYTQGTESGASLRAAGMTRVRDIPARKGWADSSVALKAMRDPVGTGGVPRVLWSIGEPVGAELSALGTWNDEDGVDQMSLWD